MRSLIHMSVVAGIFLNVGSLINPFLPRIVLLKRLQS